MKKTKTVKVVLQLVTFSIQFVILSVMQLVTISSNYIIVVIPIQCITEYSSALYLLPLHFKHFLLFFSGFHNRSISYCSVNGFHDRSIIWHHRLRSSFHTSAPFTLSFYLCDPSFDFSMPPRSDPTANRITNCDVDPVYYVHPSEGPNSVSIQPQLNGSNYISWSRSIERALGAKNKLAFINESIHVPSINDLNRSAWER
jgi:hypothetical protein